MPPPIVPSHIPCNIVAARDGQIIKMETYNGTTTFKAGDAVKKGQLLVSGVLNSTRVGYRMVHAEAKIQARTLRNIKISKEYKKMIPVETGRSQTVYTLKIFNYSINLSLNSRNLFEKCDIIEENTDLKLGKDIILPVTLVKTTYKEINELEYFMSEKELKDELKAEINEITRIKFQGMDIEEDEINFKESITGIEADYVCTVIEDIAEKREIYRSNKDSEQ
jgi:similar to stage IV sporulation protein